MAEVVDVDRRIGRDRHMFTHRHQTIFTNSLTLKIFDMKYFYISLLLSITLLVVGTVASIEQNHIDSVAQTEQIEEDSEITLPDESTKPTTGEIILDVLKSITIGIGLAVIIIFIYATVIVIWHKFLEIIL